MIECSDEGSDLANSNPVQLFSSDQIISEHLSKNVDDSKETLNENAFHSTIKKLSDTERDAYFDFDGTIAWISNGCYKRVALQFPDHMLCYAASLADRIERKTNAKVFILADTSYSSCCIDFVAAEHAKADCLIHYGDACLTQNTNSIPIRYVFGSLPVDGIALLNEIRKYSDRFSSKSFLLYDTAYSSSADNILKILSDTLASEIIHCAIVDPTQSSHSSDDAIATVSLGRRIAADLNNLSDYTLVFIGDEQSALVPLWFMTYPTCTNLFSFSPLTLHSSFSNCSASRSLRKRLFLIEKLRDANTLGLVVGTVGVHAHRQAVERMRELCQKVAKKLYVLSVGKINVAKLSNFASDIDAFILLSCPFGIMLEMSDYYRPVVSLFEAEIALNPSKQWVASSGWTAEFGSFVSDSIGVQENEDPDVSLITGRIRGMGNHRMESAQSGNDSQLAIYTAGDYFANRSWKGLDEKCSQEEEDVAHVTEGRSGIASSYASEPNKH